MSQRRRSETWGRIAEALAEAALRLKGYRILARRARTPHGEVDIVARRRRILVFVEVKARREIGSGVEAVTAQARRRIGAAANLLMPRYGKNCDGARYDIMVVRPWRWPAHIVAAWMEESGR